MTQAKCRWPCWDKRRH